MTPILFDFNGTMFLDTAENEAAWQQIITTVAHHHITQAEFKNFLHGSLNEVIVRHFVGEALSAELVEQYSLEKEKIYRQLCLQMPSGMHLTPGLIPVLEQLKAHHVPMTIASSAMPVNMDFYFDKLQLERWFKRDQVICNDGTLPGKPDPAFYLAAAAKLQVKPEECLVVEDALSGIQAAAAAQVKTIMAISSTNTRDYLAQIPEVNCIINDFNEFANYYAL
jgi:HAD superfamily hydrolase (TIGR01509 family)